MPAARGSADLSSGNDSGVGAMKHLAMVATVALMAASAQAQPANDEVAAARWLQSTGHRLAAAEPTAADLAPIVARLSGARVIGLGEVTHGTHEDVAFKALLFRELVRAGAVDTLAIEANRIVGIGFDRYVREGVGDPAALILSPSAFKIFKNDEFAGLLPWLRAWNLAHPDRVVGIVSIDDQDGAVDAAAALAFVATHDARLSARLRAAFGAMLPLPGGARVRPSDWIAKHDAAESRRLLAAAAALRDALRDHRAEWGGDPGFAEADYAARVTWQNMHVFELDVAGAALSKTPPDYQSRRDRYMADNVIERLGGRGRAALWAHNSHIMHTFPDLWAKAGYRSLGTELRRRLGADYRTVATTYTRATVTATRGDGRVLAQRVAPQKDEPLTLDNEGPDTTGTPLARLPGDTWWFDTGAASADPAVRRWRARPLWHGESGWINDPATFQRGNVAEDGAPFGMGYDILVWFRTLTPQHRWPVAPDAPKP